jgi:membrane-bound transcription factor site-1 protease
VGQQQ